jgi:endonuclease G
MATVPATMNPLALCSDNFAVLYSQTSKTPLVVVERLTAAQLQDAKGEERTNQFYADPRIPKGGRAELSDYRSQHPAVDRGHQSPAADAPSPHAMAQSFALSNMVPQDPTNNRKIWSKVESDVRKFAKRADGDVFVFTGPLFDSGHSTIGDNKVWVPTRLFKLVYDASSKRAWAYVLPNAETRIERPMDYDAFVKSTGLKLLGNLPVTGSVGRS